MADFEEQLRLEEEEKKSASKGLAHGQTKTDPDGTVFEWDAHQRAWFPKIDADFIAQYQMNYGNFEEDKDKTTDPSSQSEPAVPPKDSNKDIPPAPPVDDPGYAHWYYTYYYKQPGSNEKDSSDTSKESKEYHDYWANYYQYYGQQQGGSKEESKAESASEAEAQGLVKDGDKTSETVEKSGAKGEKEEKEVGGDDKDKGDNVEISKTSSEDYDEYYKQYYSEYYKQPGSLEEGEEGDHDAYWRWYYTYYGSQPGEEGENMDEGEQKEDDEEQSKGKDAKEGKDKGKKRKAPQQKEPPQWFEMDPEKSTSVYVTGLPEDVTDDDFKELMAKFGLIMIDPFSRKFKLKLYRDKDGKPKGDGLCSYIKPESVNLALQILDGYDYNGCKLTVEVAKFELKGNYDPTKRKKLSNKAKRKLKEKQEKLFDWRPDKPFGYRPKSDKVVVLKNVFDPKDFEKDPTLINEIRNDLRAECSRFGDLRKVVVYDRHTDGVCTVAFKEIEEADVCRDALNHRWFAQRRLIAQTWDGKTKYDVAETEAEREARLKKWTDFLDDKEKKGEGSKKEDKKDDSGASGTLDSKSKTEDVSSKSDDASQAADSSDVSGETEADPTPKETKAEDHVSAETKADLTPKETEVEDRVRAETEADPTPKETEAENKDSKETSEMEVQETSS